MELFTGASAGGLAGVITCPLDVVKTRIQTQVNVTTQPAAKPPSSPKPVPSQAKIGPAAIKQQIRSISTSSPSTHLPRPGSINLDTSSVFTGLNLIYRTEGIAGWFRGVGPRFVWTSVQSGCMLFLYQTILRKLEALNASESQESAV